MMHPALVPLGEKLRAGAPLNLLFFGTSITFGSQVDPAFDHDIVYHRQWHERVIVAYPRAQITIINHGVPGSKIADAHARLERDALAHNTDTIIIEYGINDCWDGPGHVAIFQAELARLVERIRQSTPSPLILMTANMLNHRASDEARKLAWFADKTAAAQNDGWVAAYMQRIRNVAHAAALPLADGYARWQAARARGIDTDTLLANRANHPNREGHCLLADALFDVFPGVS